MKKRFVLIVLALFLAAGLFGLGWTYANNITIAKDTPALILDGTEEDGQKWAIEEFVYSGQSWLRIENRDTDKAFFIAANGEVEIRERLIIASSPDSGEKNPIIWLENTDGGGASHWFIENRTPNLKFWGINAGRVMRGNYIMLDTSDVDDTPASGATTDPISSNWAYEMEQRIIALENQ